MAKPGGSNTGPFGIPPGGPWFVNNASGTIQRQSNPLLAEGLAQSGWTGFATQADAKAFAKSGPAGQAKTIAKEAVAPLSGLEGVSKMIGDLGIAVTDGKMWRSLGWLVLGLLLLGVGVYLLAKGKGAIPDVVPIPV